MRQRGFDLSVVALRRACLLVLTFIVVATLLLLSTKSASLESCHSPRLISHRGFDADANTGATAKTVASLIDQGISSFDVDLFWLSSTSPGASPLFVGHPDSLRRLWQLPLALPDTSFDELRKSEHASHLFPFEELLLVLRAHRGLTGQTTLELKYVDHPEWFSELKLMYTTIAASGIAHLLGVVVENHIGVAAHRAAQEAASTKVSLIGLHRDIGAVRDLEGLPRVNLSALVADASLYNSWTASIKLLRPGLVETTSTLGKPLSVWVADTEPELRRAWTMKVEGVITNRPIWAQRLIRQWLLQCAASET